MTLNISMRNWMLKASEIFLTGMFLKTEKSRLVIPGPISVLRPELPRRLKQTKAGKGAPDKDGGGLVGSAIRPRLGGLGVQFACQNARFGAVGSGKHWKRI